MTPRENNYSMPAEWSKHECCWMQWPHDNPDFKGYGGIPSWSHFDIETGKEKPEQAKEKLKDKLKKIIIFNIIHHNNRQIVRLEIYYYYRNYFQKKKIKKKHYFKH